MNFLVQHADKEHLGLEICGENKNGKSYHYRGNYQNLLKKYL